LFPEEWSHVVHSVGTDAVAEPAAPPVGQPATPVSERSGEVGKSGNRRRASPLATALIRWRRDDNREMRRASAWYRTSSRAAALRRHRGVP
jgi:hypothetical protein